LLSLQGAIGEDFANSQHRAEHLRGQLVEALRIGAQETQTQDESAKEEQLRVALERAETAEGRV
jgi:hypothetical protein